MKHRWSGVLEQNDPRRLASTARRSWRHWDIRRLVEHFSGGGAFRDDSATGDALGRLERNLLSNSVCLL